MSYERESFLEAIKREPKDFGHRYVYADLLDEHGDHEEADRQRRYEASEKWLRGFAKSHDDFYGAYDDDDEDVEGNFYHSYRQLLYFLKEHNSNEFFLPFDTPYGFEDYSEELWEQFEVVTPPDWQRFGLIRLDQSGDVSSSGDPRSTLTTEPTAAANRAAVG